MNNRGISLVEVVVVTTIVALMLVFGAPSLMSWRQNAQYKEVARGILVGLREARSLAVTNNQDITASINLDAHQLTYNGSTKTFPASVKIEASNTSSSDGDLTDSGTFSLVFEPRGSCSQLIFVQVNDDPDLTIRINSEASGLARM